MARRWFLTLVATLVAALGCASGAAADGLPLGPASLPETRTSRALAPGVTETEIVRGTPSADDAWVVDVGFTRDRAAAEATVAGLRARGHDARLLEVAGAAAPDEPPASGYLARVGRFASQAEAQAEATRITGEGSSAVRVDFTGDDGTPTSGPWRIHVLDIDPRRFDGSVAPVLATDVVPERETVTSITARTGALAGVNGGYFVIGATDGTPGDLAGVSILGGQLVSEAVAGRTDLVLPRPDGRGARVAQVATTLLARARDGATREVDGRNRKPGLIRSCGGIGGDQPTERPLHDVTCTDASELIQFTPAFGVATDPSGEVEAVLDGRGRVTALRGPGGPIPPGGSVLSGTGDAAAWLRAHAQPGARVAVRVRLTEGRRPLALRPGLGVVNGGPRLLDGGRPAIDAAAEGFTHPGDPEFYYRFGVRRNPRTMAAVTGDGHLLLVTADGRAPGYAVGLSFPEEAAVLRGLGAEDAVNLDGGGSTATVVGTTLLTRPSDATGERPVGDALVVLSGD